MTPKQLYWLVRPEADRAICPMCGHPFRLNTQALVYLSAAQMKAGCRLLHIWPDLVAWRLAYRRLGPDDTTTTITADRLVWLLCLGEEKPKSAA